MDTENILSKPKVVVFAGPNGSGKSTITDKCNICGTYVNADIIQKQNNLTAYDAAIRATNQRIQLLDSNEDFTFETVLSTERNLLLLKNAKSKGYFIRGFYILTYSPDINVLRVRTRVQQGGHDVPEEKIRTRYKKALKLLPQFIEICDVCSVYDNSLDIPCRIYKKYHGEVYQTNDVWNTQEAIKSLVNGNYIISENK